MQVWKGWTAAGEAPLIKVPCWDEWLAQLQRVRQAEFRHVGWHDMILTDQHGEGDTYSHYLLHAQAILE